MTFSEAYEKVFPRNADIGEDGINKPMVEKSDNLDNSNEEQ